MQRESSMSPKPARSRVRLLALGAIALPWACATGVDLTAEELAEICSDPNNTCPDETPVGSAGTLGTGTGGSGGTAIGGSTSGGGFSTGGGVSGSSSGGSSNVGTGGAGGAGGSGSTLPPPPLAEGECLESSSVIINYTDRTEGNSSTNQASMTLSVQNNGPSFNLPELTLRYWFTDDGVADFTNCSDCADIDYAQQSGGVDISGSISVTFGEEFGSNYAELAFSTGDPVETGGVVNEVQLRLHTSSYQTLEQSNDFSFAANASGVPNPNITPYVNGVQVGGCVPVPAS